MKKIKGILTVILILIFLNIFTYRVWAVAVTEENLNKALQSFASSSENEEDYDITVENNVITIKVDGEEYNLNYNLDSNPTFSLEIPIKQGMSYSEYQKETESLSLPMVAYIAVANIQGVSLEDAAAYFGMNLLSQALGGISTSDSKYIIVDDTNTTSDFNVTDSNGKEIIKASEFGDHVMEYVNDMYKNGTTMTDSTGINSFEWKMEQKDATTDSCKISSTLTIDLSADFSKLDGYADSVGSGSSGSNNNDTNERIEINGLEDDSAEENTTEWDDFNWEEANVVNNENTNLPKTGITNNIFILIFFTGMVVLITIIQIIKYKDVK